MRKGSVVAIILVILLIAAGWLFMRGGDNSTDVGTTTPADRISEERISTQSGVVVYTQPADTSRVVIENVFLAEEPGGFVAVHEDSGDLAGAVLGVSDYLSAGEYTGISVDLDRATQDAETLHAVLYADNGDEVFNEGDEQIEYRETGAVRFSFGVSSDIQAGDDI